MPAISVVVPVYNAGLYLSECADSILAQTFPDFELILVDDGSPDGCPAICDAYALKDWRVHVIHQVNGGLSAARNAGLDYVFSASDSQWITFIDSDDWVHPEYLEQLYHAALKMQTDISVCRYLQTNGELPETPMVESVVQKQTPEDLWVMSQVTATIACCKLYRKKLFANLRYPVGKIHEDEYTTYKALFFCDRITYIPDKMYYYYNNPQSIMKKNWNLQRLDAIGALKEQCTFFRKNGFDRAERVSAELLFYTIVAAIENLQEYYPKKIRLIRQNRATLRKTKRLYGLPVEQLCGKKYYNRLAHPGLGYLRKKLKHAKILLRRLFHA